MSIHSLGSITIGRIRVQVIEFFVQPASELNNPYSQQNYISSNYTHIARDMMSRGINVLAQTLARRQGANKEELSLSCNPDTALDMAPMIETAWSDFNLDGVVYHPIKSCRTVSTGLADRRHHASEKLGLATLFMESDMMDQRVVSEAQMRNRVDAFFEGLISREQRASA